MKTLLKPEGTSVVGFAVVGDLGAFLAGYLLMVNLAAFAVFGLDKRRAKRKAKDGTVRRIPEKTLFLLAAMGGSVGALLGMRVWHHKTLHKSFRYGIPAILAVQLLAAAVLWLNYAR